MIRNSVIASAFTSEEGTLRKEDKAFLPLNEEPFAVLCGIWPRTSGGMPSVENDFETAPLGAFATPGSLAARF